MKKAILLLAVASMLSMGAKAQSNFTLNTRAWTTNYWTTMIYDVARTTTIYLITDDGTEREVVQRIVPSSNLVFPIGFAKEGFAANDIYKPYHRAFSTPFAKLGDFGVGLDASWTPSFVGVYAGAYFKSQEICFRTTDDNLRSFCFQPRGGLVIGHDIALEAGVFYDMVLGAGGSYPNADPEMLKDGWGLDFSLSIGGSEMRKFLITFSMPLHNFLNEDYYTTEFDGMNRRVGYIMLTNRISF